MPLQFPVKTDAYPGEISFRPISEQSAGSPTAEPNSAIGDLNGGSNGIQTQLGGGIRRTFSSDFCTLYLPQAIAISDGADYANIDIGRRGAAIESSLQNGGSALKAFGEDASGEIKSLIDSFSDRSTATDVGKVAVAEWSRKFGDAGAAVSSATRVTGNPNTRALFRSVPLRTFTFNFNLIPVNEQESQNIKDIILFFRQELYPEEILAGDTNLSVGYRYPNKFRITMTYDGQEVATKIQDSYLTSFTATYNSSSMGMLRDGNFTETTISLSFTEARALNRRKVALEGY